MLAMSGSAIDALRLAKEIKTGFTIAVGSSIATLVILTTDMRFMVGRADNGDFVLVSKYFHHGIGKPKRVDWRDRSLGDVSTYTYTFRTFSKLEAFLVSLPIKEVKYVEKPD